MRPMCTITLLINLSSLLEIVFGNTLYKKEKSDIPRKSVIKRWSDTSEVECLLRCRWKKDCKSAAIDHSDCLILNVTGDDKSSNDDRDLLIVTLLKEFDTSPNIPLQGNTLIFVK